MTSNFHPPTHRVILAIDGSDHAMAAVQFIRNLPLPQDCKITILTVLIPRHAQYHATLEGMLEQTKNLFSQDGRNVETILLTGYPAEQIIQYATTHQPDLLVLGAKGLRGTIRILLGGVAQQVVQYANCPVLIVRAPHTEAKRVLLATDGSEYDQYALQHLNSCPLPKNAAVTAVHVLPPEMTPELLLRSWPYGIDVLPPVLSTEIEESLIERTEEEKKLGDEILRNTREELAKLGIEAKVILRRGDAATEILEYAHEENIDLIIVGSRGLNQIRSWFLGSVSSKITHYSECSVMVVKKVAE